MSVGSLLGRCAIVTGATGGLGRAVTRALLEDGAHCVIAYGTQSSPADVDAAFGGHAYSYDAVPVDVTDVDSVDRLVELVLDTRGRVDILAHLVGGYQGGTLVQDTTIDQWRHMIDLNLTAAFICFRAVLPAMLARNYGRIIGVSSRSAVRVSTGVSGYTASKAALLSLISCIAEENHTTNVTANAILPSVIDTPANRASMPRAKFDQWPKPEAIADVVRFLASEQSALISGAALPVFGHA
jgi:NAD(P)-dependent dehydrogenase (short-subunit alcohol dehydrogenase family)